MFHDKVYSTNFLKSEFLDKHAPDVDFEIDPRLIDGLQKLREKIGEPIRITSGFRSEHTNKLVGGASGSQHLYGKAADITADMSVWKLYSEVVKVPEFIGIGVSTDSHFIHVDVRDGERLTWRYSS